MASQRRLTSTDDIKLRVVVKFFSGPKLSPVKTLKQVQNAPADCAHDTDLEIDLHCFSYNTCRIVRIEPPLELRLFPDLTNELRVQRFETTKHYATGHMKYIFSFSKDWFNVTLDQLVQIHKKGVATGGFYTWRKLTGY